MKKRNIRQLIRWSIVIVVIALIPLSVWAWGKATESRAQQMKNSAAPSAVPSVVMDISPFDPQAESKPSESSQQLGTTSAVPSPSNEALPSGDAGGALDLDAIIPEHTATPEPTPEIIYPSKVKAEHAASSTTDNGLDTSSQAGISISEGSVPGSANWMEARLEKYQYDIKEKDLADFRTIVAKLDQAYIQELMRNKLTRAEEELLKKHLQSKLTSTEYDRSKILFYDYLWILDESELP